MTNPDNPLGQVEDGIPCESAIPNKPVSANAELKVTQEGKRILTLSVPNPVFTLQSIGGASNADVVESVRNDVAYDSNVTGRIKQLVIDLKDRSGKYVFADCVE